MEKNKTHSVAPCHFIYYFLTLVIVTSYGVLFGYCLNRIGKLGEHGQELRDEVVNLQENYELELRFLRSRLSAVEKSLAQKSPLPTGSAGTPILERVREKRAVLRSDPTQTFTVNLAQLMELRGPPGKDGVNGTNGKDGLNGRDGMNGRDGRDGFNGTDGRNGVNGRDGRDGFNGTDGRNCINGVDGQDGRNGTDGKSSVNYIRWGKQTCPSGGASVLMSGIAAGTGYHQKGGGSEYLCLPSTPQYFGNWAPPITGIMSRLSAVEFDHPSTEAFNRSDLHNENMGCAICEVSTRSQWIMLPAKYTCPIGWTREYHGNLMTAPSYAASTSDGTNERKTTQFICVDRDSEPLPGLGRDGNGALVSHAVADCGSNQHSSLHQCPPYLGDKVLLCTVCTK